MKTYDEIVEAETVEPGQPGAGKAIRLYLEELRNCTTPEELLAGEMVSHNSYTLFNIAPTKNYSTFAAIRWPWGDARGILRAGGRSYLEARLRLRDKLVSSARDLFHDGSEAAS